MWTIYLVTKKYYYWQHSDGFYNCTKDTNPPKSESGYYSLGYLFMAKNDNEMNVNGYKIRYNSLWHKWQLSHNEIGHVGDYFLLDEAIRDAKRG